MRALSAIGAATVLLGAGCLGGSSSSPPHLPAGYRMCSKHELQTNTYRSACVYRAAGGRWRIVAVSVGAGSLGVHWTITYGVGQPQRERAALPPCPAVAECSVVSDTRITYASGRHPWTRIATRHVTCGAILDGVVQSPPCQALTRLRRALREGRTKTCWCPFETMVPGKAVASIHGHRVVVPLDGCSYCGRKNFTPGDLRVLQPQS
jgi:hypothetical protein